jgi:hypothetical protein
MLKTYMMWTPKKGTEEEKRGGWGGGEGLAAGLQWLYMRGPAAASTSGTTYWHLKQR